MGWNKPPGSLCHGTADDPVGGVQDEVFLGESGQGGVALLHPLPLPSRGLSHSFSTRDRLFHMVLGRFQPTFLRTCAMLHSALGSNFLLFIPPIRACYGFSFS